MSAEYEIVVPHKAPKHRLDYAAEKAATFFVREHGWRRTTGELPHSIGLQVPWSLTAWGAHVCIAVENGSIRIFGRCSLPSAALAAGRNRSNVESVRKKVRQEIAAQTDPSGR